MSEDDDYGIFDYLSDKLTKKMIKIQKKVQNLKQSPSQILVVVAESQENQPSLSVNQPANPPLSPTVQQMVPPNAPEPNNPVLSGQLVRNLRQRVSSFKVQTAPVQQNSGQEVDTPQPPPRRRFFEPPAPPTVEEKIAAKELAKAKRMAKGMSLQSE
ncbi:hypothetical protein CEE45_11005 [Candidatus Heimdallarchaeota archaeon B3_Heim]|nr:MAG: hypothetical protein CEE45_11005 [Candidatus Heimdallarchaeota archaeon B3_Heim]